MPQAMTKAAPAAVSPVPDNSILSLMAGQYHMDRVVLAETLKKTIFPNGQATNEQLAAFVAVAHQYGLNPFLKEIYAFPTKGGGVMPIVSVDGWIKLINRHPEFDWMDMEEVASDDGKPFSCTCTIKRKDRERPTVITEYYAECKRDAEPWRMMPHRMLRHKALKECGRYAFGFGGIQDEDEARDAVLRVDAEIKAAIPAVTRRSVAATPVIPVDPPPVAANVEAGPEPAAAPASGPSIAPLAEDVF